MSRRLDDDARRLLDGVNVGHLSTLMPGGEPKVEPVWVMAEGETVLVTTDARSIKARNVARDARVALSVTAAADPYDQLLIRGRVAEIRSDEDLSVLDAFAAQVSRPGLPAPQVVGTGGAGDRAEPGPQLSIAPQRVAAERRARGDRFRADRFRASRGCVMTVTRVVDDAGIAVVTMNNPPVNAITVADTWAIRDEFEAIAKNPDVLAVILTAEGKGFNAGIDIREMQAVEGFGHLLGSGAACYAAFDQIYNTPVPVVAAVNDFCLGLGVGLVGSCDILVASTKARFGLPEVDNGALGCASHLAKLVPPFKLRQMVLTCEPVSRAAAVRVGHRVPPHGARRADGRRRRGGDEDRAEAAAGDPGREARPERDRSVRHGRQLSARAGLHVRAEPLRRRRRGPRRVHPRRPDHHSMTELSLTGLS